MTTPPLTTDTIALVSLGVACALVVYTLVTLVRIMLRPLPPALRARPLDSYDVIGAAEWIADQVWPEEEAR